MTVEHLAIVDTTGKANGPILDAIRHALDIQLSRDYADAWDAISPSVEVYPTADDVPDSAWVLGIFENADVAGALGYHDTTPAGHPYARIFAGLILSSGGTWLQGPGSVSQCVSHEALETLGDVGCNRWADTDYGYQKAIELCDFVETDSYVIDGVNVSNFLLPAAFTRGAKGPFDMMGILLQADGDPRPGCYEIRRAIDGSGGDIFPVYGSSYPEWKKETKKHPMARTARRGVDVSLTLSVPFGAHVGLASTKPDAGAVIVPPAPRPRVCLTCTTPAKEGATFCARCAKPLPVR